jgi:multicomponent Na+:H+ antiporter subunit B
MTGRSLLLEYVARAAYWIMLAASVWLLLRGHNAPGGGFIAGLIAVAASALLAIVYGSDTARRLMPLSPLALTVTGVLFALLSGVPATLGSSPFLTHLWWSLGSVKLSTVLLFDLGVYAAVWGAFTIYLFALLGDGEEAS